MLLVITTLACATKDTAPNAGSSTTDADADVDADADADTDADLDTADSGATTGPTGDTGTPAAPARDGTYVGTLHVEVTESGGAAVVIDACDDPAFTLTIDAYGMIAGTGSCAFAGLVGDVFDADFDGFVGIDPLAAGNVQVDFTTFPAPQPDTWDGMFPGPDRLQGHFAGTYGGGGLGGSHTDWDAQFDVTR